MRDAQIHSILFLLGPSGSGKTFFAEYLDHEHDWLHLPVDCLEADGIDIHGLKKEWDKYFLNLDPKPLTNVLHKRGMDAGKKHIVISFAGNLIECLMPEHMAVLSGLILPMILSGEAKLCKAAFLRREAKTGRNLSQQHWHQNNDRLFKNLKAPHIAPYTVEVFRPDGSFRPCVELYDELMNKLRNFKPLR